MVIRPYHLIMMEILYFISGNFLNGKINQNLILIDSSNGDLISDSRFSKEDDNYINAIDVTSQGNLIVGKNTYGYGIQSRPSVELIDINLNSLWEYVFEVDREKSIYFSNNTIIDIELDSNENIYVLTNTNESMEDQPYYGGFDGSWGDINLSKITLDGNLLWSKTFGGSRGEIGKELFINPEDEIFIYGETNGGNFSDFNYRESRRNFLLKVDNGSGDIKNSAIGNNDFIELASENNILNELKILNQTNRNNYNEIVNNFPTIYNLTNGFLGNSSFINYSDSNQYVSLGYVRDQDDPSIKYDSIIKLPYPNIILNKIVDDISLSPPIGLIDLGELYSEYNSEFKIEILEDNGYWEEYRNYDIEFEEIILPIQFLDKTIRFSLELENIAGEKGSIKSTPLLITRSLTENIPDPDPDPIPDPEPIESGAVFTDRESLDIAIAAWIDNETSATETYGDINTWDVSSITDFSALFQGQTTFNSDISNWDVSNGTSFYEVFQGATLFNQDIGGWDVSNGTNFDSIFERATYFNQDIGNWDVSNGNDFGEMLRDAIHFNQNIVDWDVSKGIDLTQMFQGATSFNQDLSTWKISEFANLRDMFLESDLMLSNKGFNATPDFSDFNKGSKEIPDPDPIKEVTEPYQTVSASSDEISFYPGKDINFDLLYTTSDNERALTGLGLKVHYDSSIFTPPEKIMESLH